MVSIEYLVHNGCSVCGLTSSLSCQYGIRWWFRPPIREWFSWTMTFVYLAVYVVISVERSVHFRYVHSIFICQPFSYFCRHHTLLLYIRVTVQTVLRSKYGNVTLNVHIVPFVLMTSFLLVEPPNCPVACGWVWCEPSSTSQLLIQGTASSSSCIYYVGRAVCDLFYEIRLLHLFIIYWSPIILFGKLCPELLTGVP